MTNTEIKSSPDRFLLEPRLLVPDDIVRLQPAPTSMQLSPTQKSVPPVSMCIVLDRGVDVVLVL